MYDLIWKYVKSKLPRFNPTKASGDMEKAAQNAAERHFLDLWVHFCFFHYGQSNIKNSQKHGLKRCYSENNEYKEWLRLILAVPLLPHWFIRRAFKYLLSRRINFQNNADRENFGRFKRYVFHQWVKNTKPRNLSVFQQDQATNNGPENYFKYVKSEIKVYHCNFWTFLVHYYSILDYQLDQYGRALKWGPKEINRGRKRHTERTLKNRRNAEVALLKPPAEGGINWLQFLRRVSHVNDSLIQQLDINFEQNGDRVDDPRIQIDLNDEELDVCLECSLPTEEKMCINPCGHENICLDCINRIKGTPPSICPRPDCNDVISGAIPLQN